MPVPVVAVIMAGGRGERFWPLSRIKRPKQFLNLTGTFTMLQDTVHRLESLVLPEHLYVVTGEAYAAEIARQLPQISASNLVLEPQGRDTAACIGLSTLYVERSLPEVDPVMLILPADHAIADRKKFHSSLLAAVEIAASQNVLVCIGINPSRPETGYGYIKRGQALAQINGKAWKVDRFTEKPDRDRARAFLEDGNYLWNSGMFVWRLSVIRQALALHQPQLAKGLSRLEPLLKAGKAWDKVFLKLPRISIDYGVMEKADNTVVIGGDFGWDDVGTWSALERVYKKDDRGNVLAGGLMEQEGKAAVLIDSTGCIVYGGKRMVAALGVKDLIIVDSDDALLVCAKSEEQRLKDLLEQLRRDEQVHLL